MKPIAPQQEINSLSGAKSKTGDELNNVVISVRVQFGVFEVNLRQRELRKCGLRVKLQQKPFQILQRLLETPGDFVTREELARVLWPDLHVLFDRSLNTAVNALRRALGDAGRNPRFVESRQGLGYRFIAHVERFQSGKPMEARTQRLCSEAQRDYLKGRYFSNKQAGEDLHKSVAHFESALVRDPGYAAAYAGLADTHIQFAFQGMLPAEECFAHAKKFAEAALRIDDQLPDAHTSIAGVKRYRDWDWTGAERAYRRALELNGLGLNGSDARPHRLYADYLSTMGRSGEAWREIATAQELDPLSLVINMEMAWILYVARDFQGAAEQSWKTLAMEPRYAPAQNTLGLAYQQMGMVEEAVVELDNARACSGEHPVAQAALAHALAIAGRRAEAEAWMSRSRTVSRYWLAIVHTALGECDAAFESLHEACENREAWLVWLKVEPRYDPLREDARFDRLLRRIGLA